MKIEPDQDPVDFVFVLDVCRDLLEKMGQTVHDERNEGIILQALPAEYERVGAPATRSRTLNWGTFDTWYAPCLLTTIRAYPTPSRSQTAASPCSRRTAQQQRAVQLPQGRRTPHFVEHKCASPNDWALPAGPWPLWWHSYRWGVKHLLLHCTIIEAKDQRDGPNLRGKHAYLLHNQQDGPNR